MATVSTGGAGGVIGRADIGTGLGAESPRSQPSQRRVAGTGGRVYAWSTLTGVCAMVGACDFGISAALVGAGVCSDVVVGLTASGLTFSTTVKISLVTWS